MFCPHCGREYSGPARFCTGCGAAIAPAAAALAPTSPAIAPGTPAARKNLVEHMSSRLNRLAGTEKLEGFSLSDMFSQVFRKRSPEEVEDYLITGTLKTTPAITEVQTGWPHPWLFARVLGALVLAYILLEIAWGQFQNPNLIPGLMLLGNFAVPLAMVVLFFEMNTPRNVSLSRLASLFLSGSVISLFITLIGYGAAGQTLSWMGASEAGVIEELGKLAAVIVIMRGAQRYKYILNGLLVGATVGAGFAAFESAGYAFSAIFQTHNVNVMLHEILLRAVDAPFGHIAWTAIAAGALWRAKGEAPFRLGVLKDGTFLKTLMIPIVLHAFWDFGYVPHWLVQVIVYPIDYFVIFGLVQQGLHQVRDDQKRMLAENLSALQASAPGLAAAATSAAAGAMTVQ